MNDEIIKKSRDLLESTKSKSLSTRMTELKTKIARLKNTGQYTLLCDTSGSMDALVGDIKENIRAIDVLGNTIASFPYAQIYEFNSACKKVTTLSQRPTGSTNLTGALEYIKIDNIKEIILLTDGQPNDEISALKAAQGLKINIIYIGPSPTPKFLKDLARVTGGGFDSVELIKLGAEAEKILENKIRGFLSA